MESSSGQPSSSSSNLPAKHKNVMDTNKLPVAAPAPASSPSPLLDYRDIAKLREGRDYQRYAADLQRVLTTLESTPSSEWSTLSSELSHLSRCFQSHKEVAGRTPLPDPLLFARTMWQVLDTQNVLGVQRKAIEVLQSYTELIINSPYEKQFRSEQQREEALLAPRDPQTDKCQQLAGASTTTHTSTTEAGVVRTSGRGRALYVSPLEKDFPYLCVGILHMLPHSPVQLKPELLLFLEKSFLTLLPATLLMTAAQGIIAAVLHCLEEAESSSLYRSGMRLLRLLRGRLSMVAATRAVSLGSATSLASVTSAVAGARGTLEEEYVNVPPPPEKSLGGSQAFFAALWAVARDVPSMRAPALHLLRLFILEEMESVCGGESHQVAAPHQSASGGDDDAISHEMASRQLQRAQREWLAGGRPAHHLIHAALVRALQDEREKPQRLALDLITALFPLLTRHAQPSATASAGACAEPEHHPYVLSWVFDEEEHTVLVATVLQLLGTPRTSANVIRRIISWLDGHSHPATHASGAAGGAPTPRSSRLGSVVAPILTQTVSRAFEWWRRGPVRWLLDAHVGEESAVTVLAEIPTDAALWCTAWHTDCASPRMRRYTTTLSPYECATFEALFSHATRSFGVGRHAARSHQGLAPLSDTSTRCGVFGSLAYQGVTRREVEAFPATYINAMRRFIQQSASAAVMMKPAEARKDAPAVLSASLSVGSKPPLSDALHPVESGNHDDTLDEEGEHDDEEEERDSTLTSQMGSPLDQTVGTHGATEAGPEGMALDDGGRPQFPSPTTAGSCFLNGRDALLYHLAPALVPVLCDALTLNSHVVSALSDASPGPEPQIRAPPSSPPDERTGSQRHSESTGLLDAAFRELLRVLPPRFFLDYEVQLAREVQADGAALLQTPAPPTSAWSEPQWSAAMERLDGLLRRLHSVAQCVQPFAQSAATPSQSATARASLPGATTTTATSSSSSVMKHSAHGGTQTLVEAASLVCEVLAGTLAMASRAAVVVESVADDAVPPAAGAPPHDPSLASPPSSLADVGRRCVAQQLIHGCLEVFQFYYLTTFAGVQMEASAAVVAVAAPSGAVHVPNESIGTALARAEQAEAAVLVDLVATIDGLTYLFSPAVGAPGLRGSEWLSALEAAATELLAVLARHTQWRRSQGAQSVVLASTVPESAYTWVEVLVEHVSALPLGDAEVLCGARFETAVALSLWATRLVLSGTAVGGDLLSVPLPRAPDQSAVSPANMTSEAHVVTLVRALWQLVGLHPSLDATLADLFSRAYQLEKPRLALDQLMTDATPLSIARTAFLLRANWKQQQAAAALSRSDAAPHSAYSRARDGAGLFFSGYVAVLRYVCARGGSSSHRCEAAHPTMDDETIVHLTDPFSGAPRTIVVGALVVDLLLGLSESPLLLFVPLLQSFLLSLDSSVVGRVLPHTAIATTPAGTTLLPLVLLTESPAKEAAGAHAGIGTVDSCGPPHRYKPLAVTEVVRFIKALLGLPQPMRLIEAAQVCAVPDTVLGSLPSSIDESGEFNNSNGVDLGRMPVHSLFDAIACLLFALTRQSLLTERYERVRSSSCEAQEASPAAPPRPHPSAALEALQSLNTLVRLSADACGGGCGRGGTVSSGRRAATVRCWLYTGLHSVTLLHLASANNDAAVQAALLEHFVQTVQYVDSADTVTVPSLATPSTTAPRHGRPLWQIHQACLAEVTSDTLDGGAVGGVLEELKRRPPLCLFLSRRSLLHLASTELNAEAPNLALADPDSVARFEARLMQWCGCVWELLPYLYGELKPFASQFYSILLRILWTCEAREQVSPSAQPAHRRVVTQRIRTLCYRSLAQLVQYLVRVSTSLDSEMLVMAKVEKDRQGWLTTSVARNTGGPDMLYTEWLKKSGDTLWQRGPLLEELRKAHNINALIQCLAETLLCAEEQDFSRVSHGVSYDGSPPWLVSHSVETERNVLKQHAATVLTLFYREAPRETLCALLSVWASLQRDARLTTVSDSTVSAQPRKTGSAGAATPSEAPGSQLRRWVRSGMTKPLSPLSGPCDGSASRPSQTVRRVVSDATSQSSSVSGVQDLLQRLPFLLEHVGVDPSQLVQGVCELLPLATVTTQTSSSKTAQATRSLSGNDVSSPESVTLTDVVVYAFLLHVVQGYVCGGACDAPDWCVRTESSSGLLFLAGLRQPARPCPETLSEAVLKCGASLITTQTFDTHAIQIWLQLLHTVLASLPPPPQTQDKAQPTRRNAALTCAENIYADKRYAQLLSRLAECVVAVGPLHTAAISDTHAVRTVEVLAAALPVLVPPSWKTLDSYQRVIDSLVSVFQTCLLPTLQHGDDSPSEAELVSRTGVVKVALSATRALVVAGELPATVSEPHTGLAIGRRIRAALLQLLTSDTFCRFPRTVLHEWALLWEVLSNDRTLHSSACASFSPDTSVTSRLASIVTSYEAESRVRAHQIRALAFYTLSLSPAQLNSREFVSFVKEQILLVVRVYSSSTIPSRNDLERKRALVAPVRALLFLLRVLLLRFNDVLLSSLWPFALVEVFRAIAIFSAFRLEEPPEATPGEQATAQRQQTAGGEREARSVAAAVEAPPVPLDKTQWLEVAALHLDGLKWVDTVLITHPEQAVFFSWMFCDPSGATTRSLAMRGLRSPHLNQRTGVAKHLSLAERVKLRAALHPVRSLFFTPATACITASDLLSRTSWQEMQPMVLSPTHASSAHLVTPTERLFRVAHERLTMPRKCAKRGASRPFLCIPETHYCRRSEAGWCTLALALFIAAAGPEWGGGTLWSDAALRTSSPGTRDPSPEHATPSDVATSVPVSRTGVSVWTHAQWSAEAARTLRHSGLVDDIAIGEMLLADFTSHDPDTGV